MSVHSSSNVSHIEEEALDPRVQIELENLNVATNEINRLESALEEANNSFRASLNETSLQLQTLSKKLGVCVEKARPYYEVKEKAKKLQLDCQRAAVQYQRANAVHQAARETIALAEDRFSNLKENGRERKFDSAWQEMLNHATMKIMEAEAQKSANEREHRKRAAAYTATEKEVQELQNKLKTSINKSRPYFNHRAATQIKLEAQKDRIYKLQKDVLMAKNKYSFTLRHLEQISEEIHELRRINMKREPGVGAEMDSCEPFIEKAPSRESLSSSKADEEHEYWNTLKKKIKELKDGNSNEFQKINKDNSVLVYKDDLSLPYCGPHSYAESPSALKKDIEIQGPTEEQGTGNRIPCNEDYIKAGDDNDILNNNDKNDQVKHSQEVEFNYKNSKEFFHGDNERPFDSVSLSDIVMLDQDSQITRSESGNEVRDFFSEGKVDQEKEERFPELKDLPSTPNFVLSAVKKLETMAMTCTQMDNNIASNENKKHL